MVEIFFGIITRQAIRRGTFTSVKDLIAVIETYIDAWNKRCQPFTWTKTADQILAKADAVRRLQTRDTSFSENGRPTESTATPPAVSTINFDGHGRYHFSDG